jgi:hypothetical protein
LEDHQISKLNEFFLVADKIRKAGRGAWQGLGKFKKPNPGCGSARFLAQTRNEDTPFTNGSFALSVQGSCEALEVSSSSIPKSPFSNEGKIETQAPKDLAAFCDATRCQLLTKIAQATLEKSDGGKFGG